MAGTKRGRGTVPAPDPGDELATLEMVWIRADYLCTLWREVAADARRTGDERTALTLEGGHGIPIWACVTLFLASLHTVVEGWRRLGRSDAGIDAALTDEARVTRLRALRDGVFHFGAINNPAITGILEDRDMLTWAAQLHGEFRRFMRTRPDLGRASGG